MADCKVEKNKVGKIVAVKDQSGNKSTLFQELLNVPSLSLNEAIDMYKNIYSEQLKDKVQFKEAETTLIIEKLLNIGLIEKVC